MDALTGDVERARGHSYAVADSALVGAIVRGFQLELQLWRLLQVWHGHTDELAITEPANVRQARRVRPQDRTPQGHHLVVPGAHVLEHWVQNGGIYRDNF